MEGDGVAGRKSLGADRIDGDGADGIGCAGITARGGALIAGAGTGELNSRRMGEGSSVRAGPGVKEGAGVGRGLPGFWLGCTPHRGAGVTDGLGRDSSERDSGELFAADGVTT
jgi:hypothetical protein